MALAALKEFDESDLKLANLYSEWTGDERFAAAQAMIGLPRGDLSGSDTALVAGAALIPGELNSGALSTLWNESPSSAVIQDLRRSHPKQWQSHLRNRLIAEQYYFVLLWQGRYAQAESYARQMSEHLSERNQASGRWLEFQGNAAFLSGDLARARDRYEAAVVDNIVHQRPSLSTALKLSDVAHLQGNIEQERYYRELVYGSLRN